MGKVKSRDGSISIDRISELPTEILQRILYFLSQRQAVRTSVLSKSWRYIWCTRPNLDFSDKYYYFKRRDKQEFLSIVDKNLQRYYNQRLCVEELRLRISFGEDLDQESILLLEKWIPLLTNMGVKKFCLSLPSEIRLEPSPRYLRLPPEVFGAKSLQDLRLERFMLDRKAVERIVLFKHLKSLRLERVSVEDEIFQKIISSCPLIETMCVERCTRLKTIKANDIPNLKHFLFSGLYYERYSIEIYPPSLETIKFRQAGNLRFHKGAHFPNLNKLCVSGAKFSSLDHLSSCKFPSLKSLHISDCDGLQEIKLFIDAPNIVYFKYEGNLAPSISFATTSGHEWKSNIKLTYRARNVARSSWFLKLNELLESLSQSHISLTISQFHRNCGDVIIVRDIRNNPNPVVAVDKLSLRCLDFNGPCHVSHMSSLLDSVFSICRPRNMRGYLGASMTQQERSERVKCLWKILMERESDDQFKHALWLQDFEGVSLEIKDRGEWRPTSSPDSPNYQEMIFSRRFRFALKWKGSQFFRDPSKKPRKPKTHKLELYYR